MSEIKLGDEVMVSQATTNNKFNDSLYIVGRLAYWQAHRTVGKIVHVGVRHKGRIMCEVIFTDRVNSVDNKNHRWLVYEKNLRSVPQVKFSIRSVGAAK